MAISSIGAPLAADNWVEIATNTATAGTKSFTSVPTTYRKLMLRWHSIVPSSNTVDLFVRLNNVSTANTYASMYFPARSTVIDPTFANSGILIDNSTTNTDSHLGYLIIDSANTTNTKVINGFNGINTGDVEGGFVEGIFVATDAITQVDLLVTSGTISGTATLYGAQ